MSAINKLFEFATTEFKLHSSKVRRVHLTQEMANLESQTIHCFSCPGTCCTYQANSMNVTPLEALEVLMGLNIDEMSSSELEELVNKLKKNISDFRLDVATYVSRKSNSSLRKSYTCPFFSHSFKGCTISRSIKPYGCLGFNPKASEDNGKQCASNITLLTSREDYYYKEESLTNQYLKDHLKLYWSKESISVALLELLKKLNYI